jgi:hypothetical protein
MEASSSLKHGRTAVLHIERQGQFRFVEIEID